VAARGGQRGLSKLSSLAGPRPERRCRRRFQASPQPDGTNAIDRAGARGGWSRRIPRKEVIQPQLPLRLPCYDFTPITNSTFGRCLPCGLAHGLRVFPAFVV
jgi:hypothetical protein